MTSKSWKLSREDLCGHLGYILLILGQLLVAEKNIWGWALRALGEMIWLWVGWKLRLSSVWVWGTVFVFLDLYGLGRWFFAQ